jgi:hypothetical protein
LIISFANLSETMLGALLIFAEPWPDFFDG